MNILKVQMQMMQCNANMNDAMQCMTSLLPTSQQEGVRAATTMLINVHCCTGTYRTNLATVSSNAYQRNECKNVNVAM
jgi:hypothetical protein